MDFNCVKDCSQCCIEREYYPNKRFGKIGVLLLPEEKGRIESLANELKIKITILPRIGTSSKNSPKPDQILAYQLMGKDDDGNTCPFLDTISQNRSPHGGFLCKIYSQRPLACSAYPLIETSPMTIDSKCKFCKENGNAEHNLESEYESLLKIKSCMNTDASLIWRYATGIGNPSDKSDIDVGWVLE